MRIGILSDTHGVFKDEWVSHMQGCSYLIHAGDISTKTCYDKIKSIGIPTYFVRGNCDSGEWAQYLPEFLQVPIDDKIFFIAHNQRDLPYDLTDADFIIFGHTHQYTNFERFGRVFLNPGSAGQPRGDLASMAILEFTNIHYEIRRIFL